MASFIPYRDKSGNIISYQIQVYRGRDSEGKKLKPYTMSWSVPEKWKESSIKRELERIASQFEVDCKAGVVSTSKQSFKEYSGYIMQLKSRDCKHRTAYRYGQILERVNKEIGHMKLNAITAEHLNRFYMILSKPGANKKTGEPLSAETILYHHRVIHTILKQAVKEGLIRINPSDNASPPKASRKEAKFLELEELIAIGNALKEQPLKWQSIIGLLIDSGGRRGEILALKWDDIDHKNKKINIHADLLYTPEKGIYLEESTKNGSSRMITISPEVIDILQKYRKEQLEYKIKVGSYWIETGFCFTQEDGSAMHPDSVNTWLTRFSKQYGLPHINPHAFRHSQASLLFYSGESPIAISKRLGHKKVSTTTDIYSHLLNGGDEEASNKIATLLYRNEEKSIK